MDSIGQMCVYLMLTIALTMPALSIAQAAPATSPSTQPTIDRPIRVLIVDGYSNHNWGLNTRLLRGILEPTGLFAVSVSTAPATTDSPGWDAWRPQFSNYDVVIQTCNDIQRGPQWPAEVKKDFETYVRNGGGVYVYHSGNNAFPNWPEYGEMIGLGWRTAASGGAIRLDADGAKTILKPGEGRNTGHGPRGEVLVKRLGDHPIQAGLPKEWKTPGLEVYYSARGPKVEDVNVLSYGLDQRYKEYWPLEWTVTYGQGRIYSSTFGHVWADDTQPESVRCAGFQTVMFRTLQWLAKREITVPVPADFPTAEKVSIRPEVAMPEAK